MLIVDVSIDDKLANPASLAELKIEGDLAKIVKGDNFVLFDNDDHVNRIIIFTTNANLQFLIGCLDWYMDGTEKNPVVIRMMLDKGKTKVEFWPGKKSRR